MKCKSFVKESSEVEECRVRRYSTKPRGPFRYPWWWELLRTLYPPTYFAFDRLPYSLKCSIYEKFSYESFATFEECSQSSQSFYSSHPSQKFTLCIQYFEIQSDTGYCFIKKVFKNVEKWLNFKITEVSKNLQLRVKRLVIQESLDDEKLQFLMDTVYRVNLMTYSAYSPFYLQLIEKYSTINMNWGLDQPNWVPQYDHHGIER